MSPSPKHSRTHLALASLLGLALVPLSAVPASASPDGSGVVINEAYLSGGSSGAAYTNKFIELYNPTDAAISLDGMSLQYRPATGTAASTRVLTLTGSIAADGYYLIQAGSNGTNGAALPAANAVDTGFNPSGTTGTILLVEGTTAITAPVGDIAGADGIVDALGYGASNTFETAVATSPTGNTDVKSFNRTDAADTDDNSADFTLSADITPQNAEGTGEEPEEPGEPETPADPVSVTIAELQGTTDTSPYTGQAVTTTGVVTAVYADGGFNGYYIQTPGTGGEIDLATHTASDGVFVYSTQTVGLVSEGDYVELTGEVSEYYGLTELNVTKAADLTILDASGVEAPEPALVAYPTTDAEREPLEGMLIAPQGDYTVTEVYDTNYYGSVSLSASDSPLVNPTVKGLPGTDAYQAEKDRAAAELVILDDGSSRNFTAAANTGIPLPYLSNENPVRVGAAVTFTKPVVLDYRNDAWRFQPTTAITGDDEDLQPVSFENTREDTPEDVGGDIRLGTFNVLNYFATTGDERTGCTFYTDRDGNPITVNKSDAAGCGVRGAANEESLERQQAKIVAAINALDADVVSLEEIENSLASGHDDRDYALGVLVDALNEAAGSEVWAFVPSPAELPADEDVIRTAFIYKPATVETVGEAEILIGSEAFDNAREPDAQAFKPVGGEDDDVFVVVSNHFKSKGSSTSATGDNVDNGDGIGGFNGDRTRQAEALIAFADEFAAKHDTDKVFLVGDFNSYAAETPITTIEEAGYISQGDRTGEYTYNFDGAVGSLDYIFASPAADATVTDADIWNINSVESVALEYSRYNYNAKQLYAPDVFRASDHDPMLVGIAFDDDSEEPGTDDPGTEEPGTDDPDEEEPTPADDGQYVDGNLGNISVPSTLVRGESYEVDVLVDSYVGQKVSVWLHSDPILLSDGFATVAADGTVDFTVPADAELGYHRLGVVDADGTLIGWQPVTVVDPDASSTGSLPRTGAEALPGIVAALALLALGAAVVVLGRRRAARR